MNNKGLIATAIYLQSHQY